MWIRHVQYCRKWIPIPFCAIYPIHLWLSPSVMPWSRGAVEPWLSRQVARGKVTDQMRRVELTRVITCRSHNLALMQSGSRDPAVDHHDDTGIDPRCDSCTVELLVHLQVDHPRLGSYSVLYFVLCTLPRSLMPFVDDFPPCMREDGKCYHHLAPDSFLITRLMQCGFVGTGTWTRAPTVPGSMFRGSSFMTDIA